VNSKIWTPLRPVLLLVALTAPTSLISQTSTQPLRLVATLAPLREDLPDEPLPQPTFESSSESSSASGADSASAQNSSFAQSSSTPPNSQASDTTTGSTEADAKKKKEQDREQAQKELEAQQKQRMVGVVPNFNTVLNGKATPMTAGQKIHLAWRSATDPYQFLLAGFTSAIGQATDSHSSIDSNGVRHGYEQGWTGYAKRYGANFADQFDGTMIGNGFLPALLHQDPRYYRLGEGSKKRRFFYATISTVRCKGDNGNWQPNYSNVLGNFASGGISNLYYPAADRGFGLTAEQALIVTAEGAIGALVVEFYPDVMKHFHKGPKDPPAGSQAAQGAANPSQSNR
jgi:hypothetical protein